MDPLTLLLLGALGYAIFSESDEEREAREKIEARARTDAEARRIALETERARQRQEYLRQVEERRLEMERQCRKFSSTRECFADQYVSFTRMKTYLSCPRRFKLIYLDRLRPVDDLNRFAKGRIVHDAIQAYLTQFVGQRIEYLGKRALMKHFNSIALHRLPYMRHKTRSEIIDSLKLRPLALHFCKTFPRNVTVVGIEHSLSFVLSGVKVYGIADAVVKHDSGQFEIVDYKTGSRLPEKEQLELYCIPLADVPNALPMKLRFMRLDKGYHHSWTVNRVDVEASKRRLIEIIDRMLNDHQLNPRTGPHCDSCGMRAHCDAYKSNQPHLHTSPLRDHPHFTRLRMKKPNVNAYEHCVPDSPQPRSNDTRQSSGRSYKCVRASRQYACSETGRAILMGELHFADHKGKRLSFKGFVRRFPNLREKAESTLKSKGGNAGDMD